MPNKKPPKIKDPPVIQCPTWLLDNAKAIWNEIYPRLVDVCTEKDIDQLTNLCIAISQAREAALHIANNGMVYKQTNRNGGVYEQISPYVTIQNKAMELITKVGSRFGLTPADRASYVSEHISRYEGACKCCGEAILFEPTIKLFEKTREILGKPITINSFYRCPKHQQELQQDPNLHAATNSPHCKGTALDLAIPEDMTAIKLIAIVKQAAKELGFAVPRCGHKLYKEGFLHTDLVFYLFKPYTLMTNPESCWIPGLEW